VYDVTRACMTRRVTLIFANKGGLQNANAILMSCQMIRSRLSNGEECFIVNAFCQMLDIASNQITEDFSVQNQVNLSRLNEHEILEAAIHDSHRNTRTTYRKK